MAGITDLRTLLTSMQPAVEAAEYVFCTLRGAAYGEGATHAPVASVLEDEGLTLVVPRERADAAGLPYHGTFRRITLRVHSSPDAVGLTAAVATRLAERGISANVIAAFHHDHILVPSARADEALESLQALSREVG